MNEQDRKRATEAFAAAMLEAKKGALQSHLEAPEIKLLCSLLPEGPEDVLKTLMDATFNAGFNAGSTAALLSAVKYIKDDLD